MQSAQWEEAQLNRAADYFVGSFTAMASPCMVLVDSDDVAEAERILRIAQQEADRIESKFSRYRSGNVVHQINHSNGKPVKVDRETALLMDYAATCYEMSDGMFDITSGVLRRAWKFDGSKRIPAQKDIDALLNHIGWWRITWENETITIPDGMEIDLGGIGKEYAVDRVAALIASQTHTSFVVNFGGDLYASGLRRENRTWAVGIDDPERTGEAALYRLDVSRAALATSGDARRYLIHEGKRLSHILNPKTGWPIADAPRSVTVMAKTCMEAGALATLACLQASRAREFLEQQDVHFWIV